MFDVGIDFLGGNGMARGDVAKHIQANGRIDPGYMRPYVGRDGRVYVTVYRGGDASDPKSYQTKPLNVNATLRRDEWI